MRNSAPLRLNLNGSPEVWLGKRRLSNFSTAKTEALLYFLAASGEVHRRETLAGLLWGEMPEPTAKRNLTQSLSALRRHMAPYLTVDHRSIGLDWHANIILDLTLARQAAARRDLHWASSSKARRNLWREFSASAGPPGCLIRPRIAASTHSGSPG